MRSDFAALILTHGRPDRVVTYETLKRQGYTGRIVIVIDDEDERADEYRKRFGRDVVQFSKRDIAGRFDTGDNSGSRKSIFFARNASFEIARELGLRYFLQLDDDYLVFEYRFDSRGYFVWKEIKSLDVIFEYVIDYLQATPFASICFAQGGDFIGGQRGSAAKAIGTKRKAMNTFFCDVERPFSFVGRINEDVNTYTYSQRAGLPFLTLLNISITQIQTQQNAGGMTQLYLESGTYLKSFYSVMYCPSSVIVADMGDAFRRLHHAVSWDKTAPQILRAGPSELAER